jgi:predicted TIM-barrel fold metal-dependent hydrolase
MHAGWPMRDEIINLLYNHPQVYVDIAILTYDSIIPRKAFHDFLQSLMDHGFGKRIMWGIDDGSYDSISDATDAIVSADFLTEKQKADIFYNNAARFLRLTDEQIAAHHNR